MIAPKTGLGSRDARVAQSAAAGCGRPFLPLDLLLRNGSGIHPPLTDDQVRIEAARCYFCYDAPCVEACPTSIDIPGFIRALATGNRIGAGQKILEANIFGGTCARVCPTETLCEGACVRTAQQGKPVEIGALQRVATDHAIARAKRTGRHPFERAAPSGLRVAVAGAGPSGLACAHGLAREGHEVTVFEARPKPGGLNEYGIAAYKMTDSFAAREIEFLLGIGGITIECGKALGRDVTIEGLRRDYDALFVAIGVGVGKALAIPGEEKEGVCDALDFIARLRQSDDLSAVRVGREVIVIGGGDTAIDAATQAKLLGAERVTLVYRRGRDAMKATEVEQNRALSNGVAFRFWAAPVVIGGSGRVESVTFARTSGVDGRLVLEDDRFTLPADMVLKAVGRTLDEEPASALPHAEGGRIAVDPESGATSLPGVFAGGDCARREGLTVRAVEDGKRAAAAIHRYLKAKGGPVHG